MVNLNLRNGDRTINVLLDSNGHKGVRIVDGV